MSFSWLARIRGFMLTLYFKTFSLFRECLDPSNCSSKDLSGDIIFLQMIRLMYLCVGGVPASLCSAFIWIQKSCPLLWVEARVRGLANREHIARALKYGAWAMFQHALDPLARHLGPGHIHNYPWRFLDEWEIWVSAYRI